ncbi:hypothetical protein HJG60_011335 [Phyllostomus discolor]|uniref:Uncharacterized protein n=1 Tax=Phyllostomus discolor TaxID=89673 RepID=A0A834E5H2_9CHIR|nr:hypothetical protein HJG60_011335 [Phyllostomus discolor]
MKVWVTFFISQKCVLLKMKYAVCAGGASMKDRVEETRATILSTVSTKLRSWNVRCYWSRVSQEHPQVSLSACPSLSLFSLSPFSASLKSTGFAEQLICGSQATLRSHAPCSWYHSRALEDQKAHRLSP